MKYEIFAVIIHMLVGGTEYGKIDTYYMGDADRETMARCREFIMNATSYADRYHWTNQNTLYIVKNDGSHYALATCELRRG